MRAPEFWYPADGRVSVTSFFLSPFAWTYDLVGWLRGKAARSYTSHVPVICVGNLTAGGTGKTPCCLEISNLVRALTFDPAFVSRGYGGIEKGPLQIDPTRHSAREVGDEPLLLAQKAPTIIASDRAMGVRLAQDNGATLILMDDGFQNPSVAKTISILVVDGRLGFGNRRVIPAGPLRENIKRGLGRATAIVVMGGTAILPEKDRHDILKSGIPVFDAQIIPGSPTLEAETEAATDNDGPYVAFAGIGRPQKFFDTLEDQGVAVVEQVPYPDHHPYTQRDLEWLDQLAREKAARLITTTKDHIRLPKTARERVAVLPVSVKFDELDRFKHFLSCKLGMTILAENEKME